MRNSREEGRQKLGKGGKRLFTLIHKGKGELYSTHVQNNLENRYMTEGLRSYIQRSWVEEDF